MPQLAKPTMQQRKTPVQERSAVTVQAILQATLQVLVAVGKERLTTTRVAARAGVSVGTLYQYFPNKRALLQAALKLHMAKVAGSIDDVCTRFTSHSLLDMGSALVSAYLDAKMRHVKSSAALYAVSSDIDGAPISKATAARCRHAVAVLFATAREGLSKDADLVASMVIAAMNGTAHRLLESSSPERQLEPLRTELLALVHAYLRTCTASQL